MNPDDLETLALSLGYDSYADALQSLADKFGYDTFADLEWEIDNVPGDGALEYFADMTSAEHEIWCAE